MKALRNFLMTVSIFCIAMIFASQVIEASEMNVDAGIEFTEVEPDPPKSSEPPKTDPPNIAKPTPRLPQTGEKIGRSSIFVGSVLVLGSSFLIWRKRKEVNH